MPGGVLARNGGSRRWNRHEAGAAPGTPKRGTEDRTRSLARAAVPLALLAVSAQAAPWHMRGPDGGPVSDVVASPTSLYAATQAGVYRSLDDGRTWSRSGAGMPPGNPIARLAISPTNPDVVWAYGDGIHWRSGDGGASWMRAGPETTERLWPVTFDDAGNGDSLVTYRQGERLLWHSADGGTSWRTLAIGSGVGWLDSLAVDARHRRYYAIADGQLLTAPSGTGSWRVLGQYSYSQTQLLPDGSGRGLMLVFRNIENYRVVRYDIPTRTYSESLSLPDGGWLFGDPTTPGRLWLQIAEYDGTQSWQLRESRDYGRSWDAPHSSVPVRTIAADPHRSDRLYGTGLEGLSISDDVGRHWETRTRGIPLAQVNAVALHPHDPTRILAGTALGEIRLSDDGAAQWSEPATGLPGTPILSLAYAPSEPAIAFASTASGLFRSDDGGRTWRTVATGGLPETGGAIDTLIVDAANASLLTARTQGDALYWSDDAGMNWRLGAAEIVRIAAAPSGRRIYALQQPWPNSPGRWFRLLRAERHGTAFERVEEYPLTMAVAVNPHADNVILALSNATGADLSYATRLSSDGGATWLERDRLFLTNQRAVRLQFDGCDSRTVYATTSGSTFARSHDLGLTWTYETLPASGGTLHELSTACHQHRSHVVVHGGARGVLMREPQTVDAIWRWGYDGD